MTATVSKRRALVHAAALAGTLVAMSLPVAGTAAAEGNPTYELNSNGADTTESMEACADHSDQFRFRFYYHAGEAGAWINVGHPIYDLKSIYIGVGGNQTLHYCDNGDGAGQVVANNAASAHNWYDGYCAQVFYSAGYKGAKEVVSSHSGINLTSTKNNNRSINFYGCW
ncbi:hypothetical protein [Streptomyces sp. NPDC050485]|uniref:hypothetical protein n=1 Tax=Streptomyces sp. NPDC050485 TaxID=3365617 RepID=UPI0037A14213